MDTADVQRLGVNIYQLADDQLFKATRTDGSGWDWGWADFERDWMSATPVRNAYRCLPLTIMNQTGWWVKNPVGFTATWRGSKQPGDIAFTFDSTDPQWPLWINSQFGEGIITWNTPFLFRTEPVGSRLLICGPANYFRKNVHPLTALIESDWTTMSFTMNYKIMTPGEPVRFEVGEPLFQAIPLMSNVCADLENAEVRYQRLDEDPEMYKAYHDWATGRTKFHEAKARHEVKPEDWQKDYFQGRDNTGRVAASQHMTKIKPPRILFGPASHAEAAPAAATDTVPPDQLAPAPTEPRRRPLGRRRRPGPRRLGSTGARDQQVMADPGTAGPPAHHLPATAGGDRPASCPMGMGMARRQETPRQEAGQGSTRPSQVLVRADHAPAQPAPVAQPDTSPEPAESANPVTDNHRRWIAENLLLESPPEMIHTAMVKAGLDHDESVREIQQAMNSPYLRAGDLLRNRLKKRDWLLATYRRTNRLHSQAQIIPRRDRLDRAEFRDEYYSTNRPVIITGMMNDWPALRKWNLDFFADQFGDREIEVQFGRNSGENYEVEREKYLKKVQFADFVRMIRTAGTTNDFYLTANNNSSNKQVLPELWRDIVQIPEYLDGSDPMNGFFWMGPAGTVTPFHHDLTNNFMAQVIGHKKVMIAPSWDLPLMRNELHVFSRVDGRVTPPQPNPPIDQAQIIECLLGPGEILFLPIGCLHYVEGMEISVTVSFTNFLFPNDFASFYSTYHQV